MIKTFKPLLTPLCFLKLKGAYLETISWFIPLVFSVVFTFIFLYFREINILGENGFIKSVNDLLAILVGFFIASLTAVASFPEGNLDKVIAGQGVILTTKRSGQIEEEKLTRRRFLCLLFGFNAFASLFLYMLGEFSYLFADSIKALISMNYHVYALGVFLALYFFTFFNLIMTTLLGLHYLTDRMHRV